MSSSSHKEALLLPRNFTLRAQYLFGSIKFPCSLCVFFRGMFLFLLLAFPAHAERRYSLGHSMDFTGGVGNQVGQSSFRLQESAPFYAVYPSMNLQSVGEHSSLNLGYTFSAERFRMSSDNLTTTSHVATAGFAAQLGNRARLRLSDHFDTMPNYSTINVLKGFIITPTGFQYAFEPQLNKTFSMSNSGNIGVDVNLTSASYLTFDGTGSYRHYNDTANHTFFSDQLRTEGSFAYNRKHSTRTTWSLKYAYRQNDYKDFDTARTHSASLGVSRVLSPGWTLNLEAGAAYVQSDAYTSYVVDANIAKQASTNRFDAGYAHYAGDSTGIGGASESHQGRLGFMQSLGRTTTLSFQASAFRQNQRGTGAYDYWGAAGSAALSQKLGKYFVASVGVSYTTNLGDSRIGYTYKRAYVSLGYRFPELWKTEK